MPNLTVVHGDITQQNVDAIVNAANNAMRGGGGVDGAIHRAGGPAILTDCIDRFPHGLATGDAGWTNAGNLPARWVVHTVGPNYAAGERDRSLLESCYRRALEVAAELGAETVAFPLISAGIYAWPKADAIEVAVSTISQFGGEFREVRIVAFDENTEREVRKCIRAGLAQRSTREVLKSHLELRQSGDLEGDLERNYADDVVMLSWGEGVNRGHDGVRRLAGVLQTYAEHGSFNYDELIVAEEVGMLRWSADGPNVHIHDGTDSFVVTEGRIVAQTIAYSAAEPGTD